MFPVGQQLVKQHQYGKSINEYQLFGLIKIIFYRGWDGEMLGLVLQEQSVNLHV